jgi:mannose-6-phosphate isomerase-like protein (cupin superfamily)
VAERETQPFDLETRVVHLDRSGEARDAESPPGPPRRIDGLTIGAPRLDGPPPHAGEMHPDGDELLMVISGRVTVVIEDASPPRRVVLLPGRALIVPQGVWHQVLVEEPSQLLHVTPGPGGKHRPLEPQPGQDPSRSVSS